LHNEELHILYSSPSIIKVEGVEVGGTCGTHGRGEECVQSFGRKARKNRPLGRPRCRREDGIRMDLRETGWGSVEWIQLAQDKDWWKAVVNTVMNLQVLVPRSEFELDFMKNSAVV
jgi:hypothetical protein